MIMAYPSDYEYGDGRGNGYDYDLGMSNNAMPDEQAKQNAMRARLQLARQELEAKLKAYGKSRETSYEYRGTLVMSYRPMMQFAERQRNGSYFAGNGLRFATEQEARGQAEDLLNRCSAIRLIKLLQFVPTGYRVDLSADEPNYRWDSESHKIVAL